MMEERASTHIKDTKQDETVFFIWGITLAMYRTQAFALE